jgi:hypothetical protein
VDNTRLDEIVQFDVYGWYENINEQNDLCCPKCGRLISSNPKSARDKLCSGKYSGFWFWKKPKCPFLIKHFHWYCKSCGFNFIESAKDELIENDRILSKIRQQIVAYLGQNPDIEGDEWIMKLIREVKTQDVMEG